MKQGRVFILIGILFSFASLFLLCLRIARPTLNIDGITIALLVLSSAPWILPLLKSLELPGGVKIELKDVQRAMELAIVSPIELSASVKVESKVQAALSTSKEDPLDNLVAISLQNPSLALVGFRIELEKRVRKIAHRLRLESGNKPISGIIRDLQNLGVLSIHLSSGIGELLTIGNQAAHGAAVEPEAVEWVLDASPFLFNSLDRIYDSVPVALNRSPNSPSSQE